MTSRSASDSAVAADRRTQDMAGDPFGLLLRQRVVFLGGEARPSSPGPRAVGSRAVLCCASR